MFFWIIVLSFVIPTAVRLYRRSARGRNQGTPGQFGQFPGNPGNPGNQNKQPRDGYTQQDYFGGFGQLGAPQQPGPRFPNQPFPNQPYPGQQYPGPAGYQSPVPYEDSPEYLNNQQPHGTTGARNGTQAPPPQAPAGLPSAPKGYRARKLAELDQQYSDGKMSMEDYMARRAEIMRGLAKSTSAALTVPAVRPGALWYCQYRLVWATTSSGGGAPHSVRSSVVWASATSVTS